MPGLSLSSRLGRTRLAKRVPQPDAKRSCSHKSQQTLAGSWPGVCYGQVLFCFLFVFFAWVLGDLFATQVQCKTNRAETLLVHCFLCDYGYFIPRVGLRNMRFSCRIFLAFFTNFSEANKRRWSKKGLCAYVLEGQNGPGGSYPSPNPELKALIVHQISNSSNSPHVTSRGHRRMRPLTSASIAPLNGLNGECE